MGKTNKKKAGKASGGDDDSTRPTSEATYTATDDRCHTPVASSYASQDQEPAEPLQEIQDTLHAIEDTMMVIYGASNGWRDSNSQLGPDAHDNARYVVKIIRKLGTAIDALEQEMLRSDNKYGHARLADCVVKSTTQTLTSLIPLEEKRPLSREEMAATVEMLSYKCYVQICKQLLLPDIGLARIAPLLEAIKTTMSSFTSMGVPHSGKEQVAGLVNVLITKYVQSLMAEKQTAKHMAGVYLKFANEKLSELAPKTTLRNAAPNLGRGLLRWFWD